MERNTHSGRSQRSSHLLLQSDTEGVANTLTHTHAHTHVCQVHMCTHLQYTRVLLNIHTHTHTHSPDTHFKEPTANKPYSRHPPPPAHTHAHSRQAQIAGSSLHAASSTAAGINQRNPPAHRYGSLTATHSHTQTHTHSHAHFSKTPLRLKYSKFSHLEQGTFQGVHI